MKFHIDISPQLYANGAYINTMLENVITHDLIIVNDNRVAPIPNRFTLLLKEVTSESMMTNVTDFVICYGKQKEMNIIIIMDDNYMNDDNHNWLYFHQFLLKRKNTHINYVYLKCTTRFPLRINDDKVNEHTTVETLCIHMFMEHYPLPMAAGWKPRTMDAKFKILRTWAFSSNHIEGLKYLEQLCIDIPGRLLSELSFEQNIPLLRYVLNNYTNTFDVENNFCSLFSDNNTTNDCSEYLSILYYYYPEKIQILLRDRMQDICNTHPNTWKMIKQIVGNSYKCIKTWNLKSTAFACAVNENLLYILNIRLAMESKIFRLHIRVNRNTIRLFKDNGKLLTLFCVLNRYRRGILKDLRYIIGQYFWVNDKNLK